MRVSSLGGKRFVFVIVGNYIRFIWVLFLAHKDVPSSFFQNFAKEFKMKKKFA
jgi:hypothetical protein